MRSLVVILSTSFNPWGLELEIWNLEIKNPRITIIQLILYLYTQTVTSLKTNLSRENNKWTLQGAQDNPAF